MTTGKPRYANTGAQNRAWSVRVWAATQVSPWASVTEPATWPASTHTKLLNCEAKWVRSDQPRVGQPMRIREWRNNLLRAQVCDCLGLFLSGVPHHCSPQQLVNDMPRKEQPLVEEEDAPVSGKFAFVTTRSQCVLAVEWSPLVRARLVATSVTTCSPNAPA